MTQRSCIYCLHVVFWISLIPWTGSCVRMDEAPDMPEVQVPLTVDFDVVPATFPLEAEGRGWIEDDSSQPWKDPYDLSDATMWESNIADLQVMVYDGETNELVGELADMVRYSVTGYRARILLRSSGEYATVETLPDNLRFHFLANAPEMNASDCSTERGLVEKCKFAWLADGVSQVARMPMWGVKPCSINRTLGSYDNINLGEVNLLRSMAKVEIILQQEESDADYINYAKLRGSIAKDICVVPQYMDGSNYSALEANVTENLLRYHGTFDFGGYASSIPEDLKFLPFSTDRCHLVFYIPEQINTQENHASIELKVDDTEFPDCKLEFAEYSDGKPIEGNFFNIIRNHHYRFLVTLIKGKISVVVEEWEATYENEYDFST